MSLAERVLKGDIRAAARLMRDIDDGMKSALDDLSSFTPIPGRARISSA